MRPEAFWALLRSKRRAYRVAFLESGAHGRLVLEDLARFCHAHKTTHVPGDTHGSAQLEGRRLVWLRIQDTLRLTDAQLEELRRQAAQQEGESE